jgi:hypothetical protein
LHTFKVLSTSPFKRSSSFYHWYTSCNKRNSKS